MSTFVAIMVLLFSLFSLTMTAVDYRAAKPKERKKQRAVFIFITFESFLSLLLAALVLIHAC